MKDLDNFIRKNKENFEEEPEEEHLQNFKNKLKSHQKKKLKKNHLKFWLKIAAILFVTFLSSWFSYNYLYQNKNQQSNKNLIAKTQLSSEVKEIENFYQTNLNAKMKQFENLKCSKSGINKEQVKADLEEIDKTHQQLKEELMYNTNDERVINAMINCYRKKSEVLDQVIRSLNDNC